MFNKIKLCCLSPSLWITDCFSTMKSNWNSYGGGLSSPALLMYRQVFILYTMMLSYWMSEVIPGIYRSRRDLLNKCRWAWPDLWFWGLGASAMWRPARKKMKFIISLHCNKIYFKLFIPDKSSIHAILFYWKFSLFWNLCEKSKNLCPGESLEFCLEIPFCVKI